MPCYFAKDISLTFSYLPAIIIECALMLCSSSLCTGDPVGSHREMPEGDSKGHLSVRHRVPLLCLWCGQPRGGLPTSQSGQGEGTCVCVRVSVWDAWCETQDRGAIKNVPVIKMSLHWWEVRQKWEGWAGRRGVNCWTHTGTRTHMCMGTNTHTHIAPKLTNKAASGQLLCAHTHRHAHTETLLDLLCIWLRFVFSPGWI